MQLIIYMLWTVSCGGCFLLGLFVNLGLKPTHKKPVKPTEKSAEFLKQQQELQNFWSYDGTEQEPIKEPDSL